MNFSRTCSGSQANAPATSAHTASELERHRNALGILISQMIDNNQRLEKSVGRAFGEQPVGAEGRAAESRPDGLVGDLTEQAGMLGNLLEKQAAFISQIERVI